MKVDRNDAVFAHRMAGGIPLRLEVASRCMAASFSDRDYGVDEGLKDVRAFLVLADALIDAHNATCGEVAGE